MTSKSEDRNNPHTETNLWVVIPAAGVGKRMRVNHPKQYLQIMNKTVLEHTLSRFMFNPRVKGVVVVISASDEYWPEIGNRLKTQSQINLYQADGGQERCHSVLNGLNVLSDKAQDSDWVMVHDAARPCLRENDIQQLIDQLWQHSVGGLLGLPVADTLKLCGENARVKRTVDRKGLWRALTPQMFRYGKLKQALERFIAHPEKMTDEASAMEMAGFEPVMIEGCWDNIKITHPQDIAQAELILQAQNRV